MYKLAILFSLILGSAYGNDPALACLKFTFDDDKQECLNIINEKIMDAKAANFCVELNFSSEKMDCLKAASGKAYRLGEIEVCASLTFDSDKVDCIKNNGRVTSYADSVLKKVYKKIKRIRSMILRGEITEAIIRLDRLIKLIEVQILN